MPIQQSDLDTALTGTRTLHDKCVELLTFVNTVDALSKAGWTTTQVVGGVTITQSIDGPTQDLLTARYTSLKAELAEIYGALP